ncbi:hypothetical protein HHK36_023852 [Tetracentron sinense]|uniref:Uncharacterized protein n=1 Tax=Tetracentron sinense TaxID=13715 RepID=A0A835D684_TETSI|nr:hypothetical protein HHK36_023852 [Tetracentron sinense]
MEELKVLDLSRQQQYLKYDLPISAGSLKNLRTLHLNYLWFRDISILGELKKLEILSLFGSRIEELPKEFGQMTKLRLLDLTSCEIEIILPNVISSLSKLEELYMGNSFKDWDVERTSKRSNASLVELKSLGCLTILSVEIPNVDCLPKDLRLPKLIKFFIFLGYTKDFTYYPTSKDMYLIDIQIPSANNIKCLLENTEMLCLKNVKGLKNILPDIGREVLNGLKSLKVTYCSEIEYLTNAIEGSPHIAFSSLEKLHLKNLNSFKELCHGQVLSAPSFQNLRVMVVARCENLLNVVPVNFLQMLQNLEELKIKNCRGLENVFNLEGQGLVEERHMLSLPYRLRELRLVALHGMMLIWKGPNHIVSFKNLKVISVKLCHKLRNIFSPSLAISLLQLEELEISYCNSFEGIVSKHEEKVEQEDSSGNVVISFPNLKILKVKSCPILRNIFSSTLAQGGLPQLRELSIELCYELEGIIAKEDEEEKTSSWNSHHRPCIFLGNIKFIKFYGCLALRSLFFLTLAQGLPQLEKLEISYGSNLEEIVAKEEEEHEEEDKKVGVWRKDLRAFNKGLACFGNLKILYVEFFHKLRILFKPSIAQCLLQLEVLHIKECNIMEEVVSKETERGGVGDKIRFPKLKTIELFSLHVLGSFCSGNFSFEWPSLEQVLVSNCPEMETSTAATLKIQSTPKLKKIKVDGEEILPMGDLNTVIQNWFKRGRKASSIDKDESTSISEIQEVDDYEYTSESEIQEFDKDESTSESEIQEVDMEA